MLIVNSMRVISTIHVFVYICCRFLLLTRNNNAADKAHTSCQKNWTKTTESQKDYANNPPKNQCFHSVCCRRCALHQSRYKTADTKHRKIHKSNKNKTKTTEKNLLELICVCECVFYSLKSNANIAESSWQPMSVCRVKREKNASGKHKTAAQIENGSEKSDHITSWNAQRKRSWSFAVIHQTHFT